MFSIYDGREKFFQWDLNRKLIVYEPSIKEVHFANCLCENARKCETYTEGNLTLVDVPNELLQEYLEIRVYGYDGEMTKHSAIFEVQKRTKPADYIYTPEERATWEELEERVSELEENDGGDNKRFIVFITENEEEKLVASAYAEEIKEKFLEGYEIIIYNHNGDYYIPNIIEANRVEFYNHSGSQFISTTISHDSVYENWNYFTTTSTTAALTKRVSALETNIGDIEIALDELHNYAQSLIGGE